MEYLPRFDDVSVAHIVLNHDSFYGGAIRLCDSRKRFSRLHGVFVVVLRRRTCGGRGIIPLGGPGGGRSGGTTVFGQFFFEDGGPLGQVGFVVGKALLIHFSNQVFEVVDAVIDALQIRCRGPRRRASPHGIHFPAEVFVAPCQGIHSSRIPAFQFVPLLEFLLQRGEAYPILGERPGVLMSRQGAAGCAGRVRRGRRMLYGSGAWLERAAANQKDTER